jgi:hypothetical protein
MSSIQTNGCNWKPFLEDRSNCQQRQGSTTLPDITRKVDTHSTNIYIYIIHIELTSTKLDTRITQFPPPSKRQTLPKGQHSLIGHHGTASTPDRSTRNLHPRLDEFDGVSEVDGEAGGHSAACHRFDEGWFACGWFGHGLIGYVAYFQSRQSSKDTVRHRAGRKKVEAAVKIVAGRISKISKVS